MTRNSLYVVLMALFLAGGADDPAGMEGGVPGSVAFYSARDGNNEIYVMDGDGGRPRRITHDSPDAPASDIDPDISTDGREIVFTSNRTGNNDIFVVSRDGGTPVNLTNNAANDGWARWAPNGQHLVFHSNRSGNFELYVMNTEGTDEIQLTDYPGIDQFPEWSPNGKEIAFRRDSDIYVLDISTGEARRLTNAPPVNQMPSWSPNGKQLAFMSSRAGYVSVFLMNADGSEQRNLTPKDPGDLDSDWSSRAPSWSKSGREIFFMSSRPSTGLDTEIFTVNLNGAGTTRITHSIGLDGSPRSR